MDFDTVIKNARLVTPLGIQHGELGIKDGKIVAIAAAGSALIAPSVVDAEQKCVIPGVVDPHVHLGQRKPFGEEVRSESQAAVAGGVTTIGVHLKAKEGDPLQIFEDYKNNFESNSIVDGFFHAPTKGEDSFSELPLYRELGISSYKLTWGEIEAGGDARLFRVMEHLKELGNDVRGIIHAENRQIAGLFTDRVTNEGRRDFPAWNQSRPWFCEAEFMEKSILFAEVTKCPIYIEHVTIARGVEILVRAKNRGVDVVAETCPQYLTLTSDDKGILSKLPPLGHVNPPLRDTHSNDALWHGIGVGAIDCMGSDHSPYTKKDKGNNIWEAPPGLGNMVEMTLPVLLSEGVNKARISIEKLVEICCYRPARIFGLYPRKGGIVIGADADLVILDENEKKKVSPEILHSLCDWSAYDGWELKGWPWATYIRGQLVAKQGEVFARPGSGKWLRR